MALKKSLKCFHRRLACRWEHEYICLENKHSCKELMEEMKSPSPGLTGLKNLGNTCYMNTILQCLCSVPPLMGYFLSEDYKADLDKENDESVNAFGCLMYDMWFGELDCVSPHLFYSVFRKRYSTFGEKTQQDAQEFLLCVLNELHEALKKSCKRRCAINAGASGGSKTSVITELFEGQLRYRIVCLDCETTTDRSESFTVLSLPIPSKDACSLQDCLNCFFQQDTLTSNNQVYCYRCGTTKDAAVKATITKAPQVIVFHLKRFEWQGKNKGKLSTDICYPLSNLDLSAYTSQLCSKDVEYSLCAVVNHSGFLDDGHYTAFCKNSITRNWYNFDDTRITEIPPSSVQTSAAYLLFYIRQ